ncbi:MAG: hypothetical protein IJQ47_06955 [Synergistaceae bacterium]|nr:hypothetical protein [Synergistaceae bacterium]
MEFRRSKGVFEKRTMNDFLEDFRTFINNRLSHPGENNRMTVEDFFEKADFSEKAQDAYEAQIEKSEAYCYKLGFSDALKLMAEI